MRSQESGVRSQQRRTGGWPRRAPRQSETAASLDSDLQSAGASGSISAIEQQERQGGKRSNVYLDGRYAFSLTTELVILEQLRVGQAITAERYTELVVKDQQAKALDA